MNESYNHIRQLLNLYYSGLSTAEQEKELLDIFSGSSELPAELETERILFLGQVRESVPPVPHIAIENLNRKIDMLEISENTHSRGHLWIAVASIAASILILASTGIFIYKNSKPNPYELTDPREAYLETQRALVLVAESFNLADQKLQETNEILEFINFEENEEEIDSIDLDIQQ